MNAETYVQGVIIDVCTKSFLLLSDKGDENGLTVILLKNS